MEQDTIRQRREEVEEKKKLIAEINEVLNSPGWDRIKKWADNQIRPRKLKRENMLVVNQSDMVIAAHMKGEIDGIELFTVIPEKLRTQTLEEVALLEKTLKGAEHEDLDEPDTDKPILDGTS